MVIQEKLGLSGSTPQSLVSKGFILLALLAGLMLCLSQPVYAQGGATVDFRAELLYEIPFVTSIVWAPDGRMFFTEKFGNVYVADAEGALQETPVVDLNVRVLNEDGVMSIALDPDFADNHYFYVYYTEADPDPVDPQNSLRNLVVRYTETDGVGTDPVEMYVVRVDPSGAYNHNGGRLRFDAKGNLYLSVGDLNHYNPYSQDISRVEGKIHRFAVTDDGLVPAEGNPFPGSSVWAYGLRNAFSFVFDPLSGHLFATENGPDCDDEINLIEAGANYGWGMISLPDANSYVGYCERPERNLGSVEPLVSYAPTIVPTGIMIYDGEAFPAWQGDLFFCSFKNLQMYRVSLNESRTAFEGEIVPVNTAPETNCGIEIAQGPDGFIYYSNTVGVYRIVPA